MVENIEEIRSKIKLNSNFWKYILSTNCYAYALGIDIREKDIKRAAYQPLRFWEIIYIQLTIQNHLLMHLW